MCATFEIAQAVVGSLIAIGGALTILRHYQAKKARAFVDLEKAMPVSGPMWSYTYFYVRSNEMHDPSGSTIRRYKLRIFYFATIFVDGCLHRFGTDGHVHATTSADDDYDAANGNKTAPRMDTALRCFSMKCTTKTLWLYLFIHVNICDLRRARLTTSIRRPMQARG